MSESLDGLQRDGLEGSGPQVVRGARASASPVRPDLVRNGLLALASGLFFGVGVAFALDYLDNSITSRPTCPTASPRGLSSTLSA